jgi:hypothetical protein
MYGGCSNTPRREGRSVKTLKVRVPLVAACLFLAPAPSHLFAATSVVEGGHLRIAFSPETGGITSISNTDTAHDFISARVEKPRLWQLVIIKKNGERAELFNHASEKPTITLSGKSADLLWKNLTAPGIKGSFDVKVKCRIQRSDHLAHFRINVHNNSDASILSTVFPEISGLGTSGKSDLAFPKYNWGQMFKGLREQVLGFYPSADMPMQFCSLTDVKNTLYLAAHDRGAMFKKFLIDPGNVFSIETSVPDATLAKNDWLAPFDFVLGVHEDDWVTSCKLYRRWAMNEAPWTARGLLAKRKDVPAVVKEVGVWLNLDDNFAENEKRALEFRKHMGVPIGVHWYNWHNNPFDKDYPDYLPARPGFKETVKRLNESGIYSMPYINGRLWDTQNRNYNTARPYATFNQAGEPNLEDYGSGTKLAVMCLGHRFWQNYLSRLIDRVADETGLRGIYIDQVAGAAMPECYNKNHGHTLGRDKWWIAGYRNSISAARDRCIKRHRGFFVAAENNAEPYMDFVDLFLIWIPRSQDDIPMMTAVYSGLTQYFGTNRGSDSDMSFAMLQARDFTWGAQLFWESPFILGPDQKEKLKVLTNLARLRDKCKKYIVEGELVNVVSPLNSIPHVTGKWGSWTSTLEDRTLPSIHAALWKSNDGSYAVLFANAGVNAEPFQFEFAPAATSSRNWQVQKIKQTGSEDFGKVGKSDNRLTVRVPARDGLVLQFK